MSTNDPVSQAVRNLQSAREDLIRQLERIDHALGALGAITTSSGPAVRTEPKDVRVQDRPALIAVVKQVLDREHRTWKAPELTEAVEQALPDHGSNDLYSAVRTALRSLADRGEVVRLKRGLYLSDRWADALEPEDAEGPVAAGPSDTTNSQGKEGGGRDDDRDHRHHPPVGDLI
ncbi:MAG: hypothetical protein ACLFRV_04070 [Acidimicrobiales bacterium]